MANPPIFGPRRSTAVSVHDEDEEEGRDRFDEECLASGHIQRDGQTASPGRGESGFGERELESVARCNRPQHLGDDIKSGHHRFDPSRCEKTQCYSRIEVTRDAHERAHHHRQNQPVRQRDLDKARW